MSVTVQSILFDIQTELQDLTGTRWPASELAANVSDGQRAIVALRPDITSTNVTITLAAGYAQSIPSNAQALIEIMCNSTGRKRAITQTMRSALDAVKPGWPAMTQASEIVHYMVDARQSRSFDVYPPAVAGTTVDAVISAYPADVSASGAAWSTGSGNISIPDEYKQPLVDFGLFKAWSKDAEFGGNANLAAAAFGRFQAAVGATLQSRIAVKPTTNDQPATTG